MPPNPTRIGLTGAQNGHMDTWTHGLESTAFMGWLLDSSSAQLTAASTLRPASVLSAGNSAASIFQTANALSAGATVENAAQSGSLSTISLIDRIAACTEAAASPPLKASSATAAVFKCPITASFFVS